MGGWVVEEMGVIGEVSRVKWPGDVGSGKERQKDNSGKVLRQWILASLTVRR